MDCFQAMGKEERISFLLGHVKAHPTRRIVQDSNGE